MAVPKKRTSRSKRNMRRSHHGLKGISMITCPKCAQNIPPHTTCPNCGTYKGEEIINVLKKIDKKERKAKEKARATA